MVTLLAPRKRVVSMRAWMAVDSPGLSQAFRAAAVTQPQETRTLAIWTGAWVLLVTRKWWVRVGPRGTEPKSLDSSSNIASAHEAAAAGPAAQRPTRRTALYRNIVAVVPCD